MLKLWGEGIDYVVFLVEYIYKQLCSVVDSDLSVMAVWTLCVAGDKLPALLL